MAELRPGIDFIGVTTPFFCHDGNGFFVLHQRSMNCRDEQHAWDTGAGRLEFGEDLSLGVLREVLEEYGAQGVIDQQLPAYCNFRKLADGTPTHWVAIPFIIRVNRQAVKINEPKKMDDLGWFQLGHFPTPLHTGVQFELKQNREILEKYSQSI